MRKIVEYALVVPFVILLVMAIAGAFVALFAAFAGLENVKYVAGISAGIGALGFFALLFSPVSEVLSSLWLYRGSSIAPHMKNVPTNLSVSGNKEAK